MLKRIKVYDCDGVLVDTSHRYKTKSNGTIDLDYWFANRTKAKMAYDKILPLAKQYVADCIDPETYTILCTSREYHALDVEFIIGRLGMPDKLLMRPPGNTEADAILKHRQLARLFNLIQLQKLPRTLYEDNRVTIKKLADIFTHTVYIESNQGI